MKKKIYSNGKLLLTGEYLVLDGARALAIPTTFGQQLKVHSLSEKYIFWKSKNADGSTWLEAIFRVKEKQLFLVSERNELSTRLHEILWQTMQLNPAFLTQHKGYKITSRLTFDRHWGLGSSSTLINNLAQWAKVNPYQLLEKTFGGSGYDIACACHNTPIVFTRKKEQPTVEPVSLDWDFTDRLFFVYRNRKQNSRTAIDYYQKLDTTQKIAAVETIDQLTEAFLNCPGLPVFESLLHQHENLLSSLLGLPTVQQELFPDFPGAVKSLGAWGGDFMLATGGKKARAYFENKGYTVCIPFSEMALS